MIPFNETYNLICNNIERDIPFVFSRFGDGEWFAIFGRNGSNCDSHNYYKDMGDRLREIVSMKRNGNYIYSLSPFVEGKYNKYIKRLSDNKIKWYNSNVFVEASKSNKIGRYFDLLVEKKTIMVAPDYLRKFEGYDEFVSVPEQNCWLEKNKIVREIVKLLGDKNTIVSVVASMAANVIVDELYQIYGNTHTFIDAGSVYDPYVGVRTRGYHDEILKRLNFS